MGATPVAPKTREQRAATRLPITNHHRHMANPECFFRTATTARRAKAARSYASQEEESSRMETTYTPPHPIAFLFDPSNENMEVPAYDPERVVSFNASCVSIRTISDVDGDVTAALDVRSPLEMRVGDVEVFRGVVDTPGKKVALVTSENQVLIEMETNRSKVPVRVLVDDEVHPARIWIEILDAIESVP